MEIGKLNRRVVFLKRSTTQDSYGAPVDNWTSVYQCWASIDVQNSQLVYATAEFLEKVTHRITFRWTSSVVFSPDLRILYTEPKSGILHTYEVEALLNEREENRWLTALAYELNGLQ